MTSDQLSASEKWTYKCKREKQNECKVPPEATVGISTQREPEASDGSTSHPGCDPRKILASITSITLKQLEHALPTVMPFLGRPHITQKKSVIMQFCRRKSHLMLNLHDEDVEFQILTPFVQVVATSSISVFTLKRDPQT